MEVLYDCHHYMFGQSDQLALTNYRHRSAFGLANWQHD